MVDSRPSRGHGVVTCLVLVLVSFVFLPLSILRTVWSLFVVKARFETKPSNGKVALVTGGRAQKAVYITRALAYQGYRVILAEEKGWGEFCATRFSRSVSRFYALPSGGGQPYIDALINVAKKERIDLFVPCSGVATALEEAEVAEHMRQSERGKKVETLIQDSKLVSTLHEKDTFMDLIRGLDMDAPAGQIIKTPEEGLAFLRHASDNGRLRFLVKAATVPDDVGRADMTTYPFMTKDGNADWPATERRLRHGLHIPLRRQTPYLAQEYIASRDASEWCTHATVVDGVVKAFVCCPSNDMLMTYHNATHTFIGHRALTWTQTFLSRLSRDPAHRLTGQFSFDFIYLPEQDRLVVIECNPRVHTAVCLLQHDIARFATALDPSSHVPLVTPNLSVNAISWSGYDIFTRYRAIARRTAGQQQYNLEEIGGTDGAWLASDPMVYLFFYHVQWPALLLRQAFVRRTNFSRINVSTARIFECKH